MNKIKELNSIFIYRDSYHESIEFPFLDWIYIQCSSKDIRIIDKFWFEHWDCRFFSCLNYNDWMLWDLYLENKYNNKFLYF
jgi:hypothetical protein